MKLGQRLAAVASNINCNRLIDIGCDHGKLTVFVLLNGLCKRAVCVDISPSSLKKAKNLADKYGVSEQCSFVCADGNTIDWTKTDCIVIAGLGGLEIMSILGNKSIPDGSVFVPHQDSFELRKFLNERGIAVAKDTVVFENGKYYDLIVVGKGKPYDDSELYLGKNLPPSEFYIPRAALRLEKIKKYENLKVGEELLREKEAFEKCLN